MLEVLRGADVVVRGLRRAGVQYVFALSGNQIMSLFDAGIDSGLQWIHVRHEAAAVHMADAWGRLTGRPGVALVTAGPGFANTLSALYVARMAESPLVLLSGHAPREQLGRGAFQEMPQAEMALPVVKASWTVTDQEQLEEKLEQALFLARSGRPGPVHLALPVDILEATGSNPTAPLADGGGSRKETHQVSQLGLAEIDFLVDALQAARRPLLIAGPAASRGAAFAEFTRVSNVPVIGMESPRGVNDPSLGALAEILPRADLVLLWAKSLNFTLRSGQELAMNGDCKILQVDPDLSQLELTRRVVTDDRRLVRTVVADAAMATTALCRAAGRRSWPQTDWFDEVRAALVYRPPEWAALRQDTTSPLHPAALCDHLQSYLTNRGETDDENESVLISDGGEFGQWAQACLTADRRLINGPSGSIGAVIPFALAARLALPDRRIIVTLGDGTFGFHALEFDTAVRYKLPFIAVVGNDSMWNAEYQIQLRQYGAERAVGCELLPTRYDRLVESLGGHGEQVSATTEMIPALERAHSSGLPACLNVALQRAAAPVIRRSARSSLGG